MPAEGPKFVTRRDIHFDLSKVDMHHWHPAGIPTSHFFNVQSLLFPQGERFFIRSVRHFRSEIDDAAQQSQIAGFIGQEATHGREHEVYNARLAEIGYPIARIEKFLRRAFRFMERMASPQTCLAMTVAFEHLTAIAAESMLANDQAFEGADPEMARLWRWHSFEETEHKAVAFDVYRKVAGSGFFAWLKRCIALLLVSIGMQLCIWVGLVVVLARSGNLLRLREWGKLFKLLWLRPGLFRREFFRYFYFFKPGFHPWDIDNSAQLRRWEDSYPQDSV